MRKKYWKYKKGKGRFYDRGTETIRYPDSGEVYIGGRKDSMEVTRKHAYGYDKGFKTKKTYSRTYIRHPFISHGKRAYRGGYKRRLV